MRRTAILLASLTAACCGAQASSIITLGEAQSHDPSIVTATTAMPGTATSPSIIVLGEPAVSSDKVAAIPDTPGKKARAGGVMVIRAGVAGGVSVAPVATPATTTTAAPDNGGAKAPTLRDAMTQNGRAPAVPQ